MDDATIQEMARQGHVCVPTIDHNRFYAEHAASSALRRAPFSR